MANPYSKLFNVFAVSVLALALYINFAHTSDAPASQKNRLPNYQQATAAIKAKPVYLQDNAKSLLLRDSRKN